MQQIHTKIKGNLTEIVFWKHRIKKACKRSQNSALRKPGMSGGHISYSCIAFHATVLAEAHHAVGGYTFIARKILSQIKIHEGKKSYEIKEFVDLIHSLSSHSH
jgi:hypothetical protein